MKKYFLLVFGIFICMIIPKTVFAETITGTATIGRGAVMDTSNNYSYTDYKSLSSDSINALPINAFTSATDFYIMGAEYSYAIALTGQTNFAATVRVPVATDTIYNYTLTDGLNQNDFKVGLSPNFSVYNITPTITSFGKAQGVYSRNGVAHTYIYYDVVFNFVLDQPLTGSYNLNFAMLNTTANRSTYYYSGGGPGTSFEFPVAYNTGQTTPDAVMFSTMSPSVSLSTGTTGNNQDIIDANNENTELIINNQNENTEALQETIEQSYENLVNSQEVCNSYTESSIVTDGYYLVNDGSTVSNVNYGISGFIPISSSSTLTILKTGYVYSCFYNKDKTFISCFNNAQPNDTVVPVPSNASYVKFTFRKGMNSFSICSNGNQAINDSLNDSNVDGSSSIASGLLEDAQITDKGLTGLVATVLDFINDIFDCTCSPLSFELPFVDTTLTLPCMSTIYTSYFPDLFNLYQLITTGFIAYRVIINLFDKVKKVQDPEYDKVEVLQL